MDLLYRLYAFCCYILDGKWLKFTFPFIEFSNTALFLCNDKIKPGMECKWRKSMHKNAFFLTLHSKIKHNHVTGEFTNFHFTKLTCFMSWFGKIIAKTAKNKTKFQSRIALKIPYSGNGTVLAVQRLRGWAWKTNIIRIFGCLRRP